MSKLIDLTGQKFGRLAVLSRAENRILKSGRSVPVWNCKCDCGKFVKVLNDLYFQTFTLNILK